MQHDKGGNPCRLSTNLLYYREYNGKYMRFIDLTGQQYGRLTVIERAPNRGKRSAWLCKCNCSDENEVVVTSTHLRTGHTISCGCYNKEILHERRTLSNQQRIYKNVWRSMLNRCYSPKNKNYHNYGARGIAVCDKWRESFEPYWNDVSRLAHFGEEGYSVDRIDNDGNYCPENVKMSTIKEQANNKRTNALLTHNGQTKTIHQWAQETGITATAISRRIERGWSTEETLTTPMYARTSRNTRFITFNSKTQSMKEWAIELGMNPSTLRNRIEISHWSIEKALTTPVKQRK